MIDKLVFRIFLLFSMYFSFVFAQESVSVSFSVDMNDVETNEEGVYLAGGVLVKKVMLWMILMVMISGN